VSAESPEHRRLVRGLIGYFNRIGFTVTNAACEGYTQCPEIDGRIPDVWGRNNEGLIAIGEAKTNDDLENERTDDQFMTFSNRVMSQGQPLAGAPVPFYIGITRGYENQVMNSLVRLGISDRPNIHVIGL
jgi:hypothetical protein